MERKNLGINTFIFSVLVGVACWIWLTPQVPPLFKALQASVVTFFTLQWVMALVDYAQGRK